MTWRSLLDMPVSKAGRRELLAAFVDTNEDYMSTADAAKALGVSQKKLWWLANKGELSQPVCKTPRQCFVLRTEIEALGCEDSTSADDDGYCISRRETAILGTCMETVSRMVADGRLARPRRKANRHYFRLADIEAAQREKDARTIWKLQHIQAYTKMTDKQLLRCVCKRYFPPKYGDQCWLKSDVVAWWEECDGDPVSHLPEWEQRAYWELSDFGAAAAALPGRQCARSLPAGYCRDLPNGSASIAYRNQGAQCPRRRADGTALHAHRKAATRQEKTTKA